MQHFSDIWSFLTHLTIFNIGFLDCAGILGFCLYIINYTLVTFQKIDSRGITYFTTNIMAATCVLASLMQNFNLAAALIQIFWIALGIIAIVLRLLPKSQPNKATIKRK